MICAVGNVVVGKSKAHLEKEGDMFDTQLPLMKAVNTHAMWSEQSDGAIIPSF